MRLLLVEDDAYVRSMMQVVLDDAGYDIDIAETVEAGLLRPGLVLEAGLQLRIRKAIGSQALPAHVPALILQVDQLPTTHTGKLSERSARDAVNGLRVSNNGALRNPECLPQIASHPGLTNDEVVNTPGTYQVFTAEGTICEIARTKLCKETLGIAPIGQDDDLFDIGVDSLGAIRLILGIEKYLGLTLPITFIYEAPTIARMIPQLETIDRRVFTHLIPIKEGGVASPFFMVHGLGGNVIELFKLGRLLDYRGPVYAIQARGVDGQAEPIGSVEDMADAYIAAIRAKQPNGPYRLCGYSFGGLVAFEMARRLQAHGERIEPLILLDTTVDERCWPTTAWLRKMSAIARKRLLELNTLPPRQILRYVVERLHGSSRHLQFRFGTLPRSVLENSSRIRREFDIPRSLLRVHASALDAMTAYRPAKYSGEVTLMRCAERSPRTYDAAPLWASICQKLAIYQVPGNQETMIKDPAVEILADTISRCL